MFRHLFICCVLALCMAAKPAAAELLPDFLMETDPEFHAPPLARDFKRDFKGLWLQALQRPESDYQRLAAESVARAHRHGIPGLVELTPALENILSAPTSHPAARFAAARALIVLDSRNSAEKLFAAGLNHGSDLRQLVEPALAEWDYGPARVVWRERLGVLRTSPRDLSLALRGLGRVRDADAVPTILNIAMDLLRPSQTRLDAAQAAGEIADSGLESLADQLSHDRRMEPLIHRLCAVRLLSRHSSESARRVLVELANDSEPAVAALALNRLNEIDPQLVAPLAQTLMSSADPLVREAGARAFLAAAAPERIKPLAKLLDDQHPAVRKLVAEGLFRLAVQPELNELIRSQAMTVLRGDRWQGQTQAALLLGALGHKPAADRFVELLESQRPDVMIASAWGLRKVAEPHTIPAIADKIRRQTAERKLRTVNPGVDEQVAHLFEACGEMQATEAEPLMMEYVPRDNTRTMDLSRSAAIWALGRLHLGTHDVALADALIDRVMDSGDRPPEGPAIKRMAVVTLVRMDAKEYAPSLKDSLALHQQGSALDVATRWAIRELTGEEMSPPSEIPYPDGEWFLEPLLPSADGG